MHMRPLGRTGLDIAPLVFGGNVFGWTADEMTSFRLLDAFIDAGCNAIDTADVYSRFVEGNSGGESETIIGDWLAANPGKREKVTIITKVGMDMGDKRTGLSQHWIPRAVEDSLSRLKTDYIDLYLAHQPDPHIPLTETLGAFAKLRDEGKIRAIGGSNYDAPGLRAALDTARDHDLPRYDVLQPEYNLYDRSSFDGPLHELCQDEDIGVITYFSLASGFLTGKYRDKDDLKQSQRGGKVEGYLDARGHAILGALDQVAEAHGATPAEVALAWLIAQPGVTAPIASATSLDQLRSNIAALDLDLTQDDLAALATASG